MTTQQILEIIWARKAKLINLLLKGEKDALGNDLRSAIREIEYIELRIQEEIKKEMKMLEGGKKE